MIDILDLHTHTIASGHAYNTLYEMAKAAAEKGLSVFGSTDHAPRMPGACHELYFVNFKFIPRTLYGVKILMGSELNILDYNGKVDLSEQRLKNIDYSIASIHEICYESGTVAENTNAYVKVLENPLINIIGHPDDSRYPIDYDTLAAAAADNHKLLEVNSSSLHPLCARQNAWENYHVMLERCIHYHTSVIINSDAHIADDIGNHGQAWELLKEVDFPQELIVNTSIHHLLPFIPKLEEYL